LKKGDRLKIEICFEETVGEDVDWFHSGLGYRPFVGCCENHNKHLGSMKRGEFIDYLRIN
jgi:hypothetical protein